VLIGLVPGLVSDALSALAALTADSRDSALSSLGGAALLATLFMPLLMLVYLIIVGRPYVRSGQSPFKSTLGFVFVYSVLNLFLWGAGCTLILSGLQFH
jgi:asparagine N-glycosylation enzyme membrane subunit Stt3